MDLGSIFYEIKLIIINYLPINKLISDNPPPIFHEYIMNYINKNILINMYVSGRLYKNDIYHDIVYGKVNEISSNITQQFIKAVDEIGRPTRIFNESMPIISLKILFKFTTVGKFYNGNTNDIKYCLSNYGIYDNYCTWRYNDFAFTFEYTKENIHNEIMRILIKNMDYSDTTVDITNMELIKTDLLETNCNILFKFI